MSDSMIGDRTGRQQRRSELSVEDLEHALHVIAKWQDDAFFAGERAEELVARAEDALGVRFPPTYRRFVRELGAGSFGSREFYGVIDDDWADSAVPDGIWYTLSEREEGLSDRFVVVGAVGDGTLYALDTARAPDGGEAPVVVVDPGAPDLDEDVAPDFGTFFRQQIDEELADAEADADGRNDVDRT
jgi:antitoxin YobK